MSDLTPCNYCNLRRIRARAKKEGKRVYTRLSGFMGGTDVFVVPRGEKLPPKEEMVEPCDEYPNGNEAYSKYHVAWMMEIGKRCEC